MDIRSPVMVIVCGGSPAPGMNGVISAAAIEALNNGIQVIGIFDGFSHVKQGISDYVHHFVLNDVSSLHDQAGCFLRTSRNQLNTDQEVDNALRVLQLLRCTYLVTIGGVETAHSAYLLSVAAKSSNVKISMVHVPKTIFNDLPLPPDASTFGFSTARDYGVELVRSFRTDARTLNRYYFVTIIGNKAGRLALSIGKAAAATAIFIPEEFPKGLKFQDLVNTAVAMIIKRTVLKRSYGIAVFSEGLVDILDEKEANELFGNLDNGHHELSRLLSKRVEEEMKKLGSDVYVGWRYIGSELRSAPPNASDVELARDLGYSACRYLLSGGSGEVITFKGGSSTSIPLEQMMDVKTGQTIIRKVDLTNSYYEVCQKYQLRLTKKDLEDPAFLHKVHDQFKIAPQDFVARFGKVAHW